MSDTGYPWYEITSSAELEQGDLITDCPVFTFPPEAADPDWNGELQRAFVDALVLTQSCDLVVRPKTNTAAATNVVVCPIMTKTILDRSGHPTFGSPDKWNRVIGQHVVGWRALAECTLTGFERELSAVDLRTFYTLPFAVMARMAVGRERLRLRSPYRENIAQAFGQQFSRVALPTNIERL